MAVAGSLSLITSDQIADSAVTNDKLAGSIANSKLVNDSVTVNGTSIDLGASETITAGKILQVVSVTKTDAFFTTVNNSFTDITGLTLNITPSSKAVKFERELPEKLKYSNSEFVNCNPEISGHVCMKNMDAINSVIDLKNCQEQNKFLREMLNGN